jgi:signal recognition particle subunit SRP54
MFDFLAQRFGSIFTGLSKEKVLTQSNIEEVVQQIKNALIEADVPHGVVDTFMAEVQKELVGQKMSRSLRPDEFVLKIVYQKMVQFLDQGVGVSGFTFQIPSVVMVMGLQGSGKTTTTAKLAHYIQVQAQKKHKSRSILLGSVDFYRPAAIDQLEILAGQIGVDFYRTTSKDPVQAAVELHEKFKKGRYELFFLDTAGRLHVDQQMLTELAIIDQKLLPKYKLLVLDGMTGQQSLSIAQSFDKAVGFYSSVLTKMDSGVAGGAVFAFRYMLKKPIWFIGTGEKIEDLQEFYPDRIAQRMLNMGDLQTLIEKTDAKISSTDQQKMEAAMLSGNFTLDDFLQQMDVVSQLGSLSQVLKYIPGVSSALSCEQLEAGDRELKRFRTIISSMTKKERNNIALINDSRKKRIAKGAGVEPKDVGILLERFEHVKQYAKLLRKSGPFKGLFR